MTQEQEHREGSYNVTLASLTSRVWTNSKLTVKTKMAVYIACVLSIFMEVRHGPHMPARKRDSTASQLKSCLLLAFPPCTPC